MTSTLIVPIDVAALAVGQPDAASVQALTPMADFSQLGASQPYLSDTVLNGWGANTLLEGVHLHWALPDGLTAGQSNGAGMTFPRAPNRWLVTRIVVSAEGAATLTSWVVESDRLSADPTARPGFFQPTVPVIPPQGDEAALFSYLGASFDLATWQEVGDSVSRLAPLTAMGHGETTFAAFYPNCSTVFGFYDALTDLGGSPTTISYQVSGWYATAADDPLMQPNATPATYGWSCADGGTPTATVCTGVIDEIAWDPAQAYLAGEAPNPLDVAIASSPQEAVAALIQRELDAQDRGVFAGAELAVNALQFGLLSGSNDRPDAVARLQEAIHRAGFARSSGGQLWTVDASSDDIGPGVETTLPDDLAEPLNALNAQQLELNDLTATLVAVQQQLFADWWKFDLAAHHMPGVPSAISRDLGAASTYLQGMATAINDLTAEIAKLQGEITTAQQALAAQLGQGLTLTNDVAAPRYYAPADPFVLVWGEDVTPADRYGNDGDLPCRLDTDAVSAADLAAGLVTGSSDVTVAASSLPALAAQPAGAPWPLLQALVWEAFFLADGLQPTLAAAAAAQGGASNPAVIDPAATVAALQAAATAFLAQQTPTDVTYTGTAPASIYYAAWSTPWLPILLRYDVELAPVQYLEPGDTYPADFINANWSFGETSVDLQYSGGALPTQTQAYAGTVILTPNATLTLSNEVAAFLEHVDSDPGLTAILDGLDNAPFLAQSLSGFSEALLMRALTMQLPVADPYLPFPYGTIVGSLATAIGSQTTTGAQPANTFNPISGGLLTIEKLELVDAFGRFKRYQSPPVTVAQALQPPASAGAPGGAALLPPRITQPSRLLFRWRATDDDAIESNSVPATSPVAGWVVPTMLGSGFALYAPDGTALGELALSADESTVLWTPAPGGAYPIDTPLTTVLAGQPQDLLAFAEGIYNSGDASFFAPFFDAVRDALTFSLPARFRETAAQAVLLGQPLVLARATLTLDLAGPPAGDQSWATFEAALSQAPPPPPPTLPDAGVPAVQFPVQLGALNRLDDTLVAYWIAPADAADFRACWAPYAGAGRGGVGPPAQDTLALTPVSSSGGGTDVVVLFDPRGTVHATTGVLPVKEIDIPPDQYAQALASLAVTFETTPVLSGSNQAPQMVMVQPSVPAGSWSWVTSDGSAWAPTALTQPATAQATLSYSPQTIAEGWLSLTGLKPPP